ncbi:lipoprotein signal peptidase [Carboxylicivirga sediminis]|uniref:Lipoprotein signal peptidase n=1 Tax=Carboxylicivirga sediminis TaxID=2006564 RepID=A0A941F8L2_9BACT|nr:lipoprotein signal peptidase [Carboxylicivirga sediminis]MBR8537400.1 lipoprotein signal peptidase [Carboxylicivirga sediminis]
MSVLKKSFLIIFLILLVDQVSKFYIKTHMMLGDEIPVLGNWFIIHFVENNGMAFGMQLAGKFGKAFLSIFRIVAVVGIGWYMVNLSRKGAPKGLIYCVGLVLAGALGNIIDSAFYGMIFDHSYGQIATFFPEAGGYSSFLHGKVVDMLYFPLIEGRYPEWMPYVGGNPFIFFRPVFNIADSSITIGIIIILFFQKRFFKE